MAAPKRIDELTAGGTLSAAAAVAVVMAGSTVQVSASKFITEAESFTRSDSGSVSRTVQSKLQDTVSILEFIPVASHAGIAAGTNTDDLSTYFANAAATGKRVFVPAGTYHANARALPSNTYFFGEGEPSVIKLYDTTLKGALGCDSGSSSSYITGLVFRDLKFLGTVESEGFNTPGGILLWLNGVKRCLVENCYFVGFRNDGLYVGSGPNGTDERHNVDVVVRNCVFDGVNNDNRNGMSVIDADGMLIEGCTFRNCAKATMPGSLDFEPDQSFGVIKNVRVVNNRFFNTDGNRGHIVVATQNTTNVENIVIAGNHCEDVPANSAAVLLSLSTTTPTTPLRIVIENNTLDVTGSRGVYKYNGEPDGVTIRGNIISAITGIWFSYVSTEPTSTNILIEGNEIYDEATSAGILFNEIVTNVSIKGNLFKGTPANHIQIAGTSSSGISIVGNEFVGAPSTAVITHTSTTKNPHTNVLLGNRFEVGATHTFAATRSDYAGTGNTIAFTDTPATFAPGYHYSRVSVGSGGPTGGSDTGSLYCHRPTSAAETDTYQWFVPQYNGAINRARLLYFRKAVNSTTWGSWYIVGGELVGSATYDPPDLAAGATQQTTVTVSGCQVGDAVIGASFSNANADIVWLGEVTSSNTVTVTQWNRGAGAVNLASGTLRVCVKIML